MHQQWKDLCEYFEVEEVQTEFIWNFMETMYSAKGRYYHTLKHIEEMIEFSEVLTDTAEDFYALQLACWFHDIVYNTMRADNEVLSSMLCDYLLGYGPIEYECVTEAARLIRVTTTHLPDAEDIDAQLLCDLDLMRLGAPWESFKQNNLDIRSEYIWVAYEEYKFKRGKILSGFLHRPRIFNTPLFYDLFEVRARGNLERLLADIE